MGYVSIARHVDAPIGRVFDLVVSPPRLAEWMTIVTRVHDAPEALDRPGATYHADLKVGGRRLTARWTVTKVVAPRLLRVMTDDDRDGRSTVWLTLTSIGEGTEIQLEVDYELPAAFLGQFTDRIFVQRGIARELRHSLMNLGAIAEEPAAPPLVRGDDTTASAGPQHDGEVIDLTEVSRQGTLDERRRPGRSEATGPGGTAARPGS